MKRRFKRFGCLDGASRKNKITFCDRSGESFQRNQRTKCFQRINAGQHCEQRARDGMMASRGRKYQLTKTVATRGRTDGQLAIGRRPAKPAQAADNEIKADPNRPHTIRKTPCRCLSGQNARNPAQTRTANEADCSEVRSRKRVSRSPLAIRMNPIGQLATRNIMPRQIQRRISTAGHELALNKTAG